MAGPGRVEVVTALLKQVLADLEAVERMAELARDEATSEESKQEGQYDTRATEASYLARGQAERVTALRRLRDWLGTVDRKSGPERVGLGSLVQLEDNDEWHFVAPAGGTRCTVQSQLVRLTSLDSPIGRAMAGLEEGDDFEVNTPRQVLEHAIERLS